MNITVHTPDALLRRMATACKDRRLSLDLSVTELASQAGLSRGTLQRFEKTGQISTSNLLALLISLGMESRLIDSLESRDDWRLEELQRLNKRKAP